MRGAICLFFQAKYPTATALPFASTGGAALIVYNLVASLPKGLLTSVDYVGIMHCELGIPPSQQRQVVTPTR